MCRRVAARLFSLARRQGTGVQVEIADQIAEGAASFLITEYKCLVPFVVVMFVFIVGVLEGQDKFAPTTERRAGGVGGVDSIER